MNDIKFGKYLKKIRKKYNFSKEYVANILKVKESLVSDWESGRLTLNDEYMEKLSLFYGVNLYKKRSKNITMEVNNDYYLFSFNTLYKILLFK